MRKARPALPRTLVAGAALTLLATVATQLIKRRQQTLLDSHMAAISAVPPLFVKHLPASDQTLWLLANSQWQDESSKEA